MLQRQRGAFRPKKCQLTAAGSRDGLPAVPSRQIPGRSSGEALHRDFVP